jgi:hypothetical protein
LERVPVLEAARLLENPEEASDPVPPFDLQPATD